MLKIHIVNSVKGGSGKSTLSLYLANYLRKHDSVPVIIDLDVCGTTWFSNNKTFIYNLNADVNEHCFLNDLFYNYEQKSKKEHFFKLKVFDKKFEKTDFGLLNVIMSNPKKLTSMNDDTLDLLESVVFQLVNDICYQKYKIHPTEETVTDIIFDMPPGYEKHSERIIRHLIMDLESKLYQKKQKRFEVYLYMLSNFNQATYESNLQYVNNLFSNPSFSMDTSVLSKENIMFVLNDINGITEVLMRGMTSINIDEKYIPIFKNLKANIYEKLENCKVFVLHRTRIEHEETKLKNIRLQKADDILTFGDEVTQFDPLFSSMYGGGVS